MRVSMILLFGCALILMAGCNGPSPHFRGAEVTRVIVDGARFDVRQRGRLAEAVRTNPQYAPRLGRLGPDARAAMERATGCRVARLAGDAAVTVGRLSCGSDRTIPPAPQVTGWTCTTVSAMPGVAGAAGSVELDCVPG